MKQLTNFVDFKNISYTCRVSIIYTLTHGVSSVDTLIKNSAEDCLFLDITVPGGVNETNKKPVMVWIHGGGYVAGSKNGYLGAKDTFLGATLAKQGDVIIVAINYRLDILGFLSDGPGSCFPTVFLAWFVST